MHESKPLWRKWIVLVVVAGAVLLLDQFSKAWILSELSLGEFRLITPWLHPYLQITYSQNTGAAFGILDQFGNVFIILALVISAGILYLFSLTGRRDVLQQIGFSMVLGGALGNAIDRYQHGFVVDFVHVYVPGIVSNVSNFADHAIVLGVMLLLLDGFILQPRRERHHNPGAADPALPESASIARPASETSTSASPTINHDAPTTPVLDALEADSVAEM